MELTANHLHIHLSRAARAELIRKMQRTGGDPSNRKALVVYDPANPGRLKVGIVEESAAKKGQVVVVSDIDLLFRPGEAESFNGGTIQFEASAENMGIWSVSYT